VQSWMIIFSLDLNVSRIFFGDTHINIGHVCGDLNKWGYVMDL
jgi:hypothetical protein